MELDPTPEATTLAGMTVAQICLDVARKAANACDLEGDLTDDVVTRAIIDRGLAEALAQVGLAEAVTQHGGLRNNCSHTANMLFPVLSSSECVEGEIANLALRVGRATDSERAVFRVKVWNHEFIVVVRNGKTEILQSFESKRDTTSGYSFGWCLRNRTDLYAPAVLQQHLRNITDPNVQKGLFGEQLTRVASLDWYREASLRSDRDIWGSLYNLAIAGLRSRSR